VIKAADRAPVVREMLTDIPLPDGFDPAPLETGTLADRYQLGAQVTAAVSCAWLDLWLDATERGDASAADQAADALATSRDWAILQEMDPQGGWSSEVWAYADAVNSDGLVHGEWTVRESYGNALGCRS
jgi:hypothetical protein